MSVRMIYIRMTKTPVKKVILGVLFFIIVTWLLKSYSEYPPQEGISEMILEDSRDNHNPSGQACIHPKLELWNAEIKKYFAGEPPLQCADEADWVFVENGTLRISSVAIKKHGDIKCDYSPLYRIDDYSGQFKGPVNVVKDGTQIETDFFKVHCRANDSNTYSNIHAGIAYVKEVHERMAKSSMPPDAMGVNVMMLGFDSCSRMTWMRNLPKSHDYFVNELGAVVLEGYNIVGDGTPQALLPILTGQTEPELPEARRGKPNAKPVDNHPWIWNEFKKAGYATQYGEDDVGAGTFHYRMLGFHDKPVDHETRTFYVQARKLYSQNNPYCLGAVSRHVVMMNYMMDFMKMYNSKPRWSFLFSADYSHDSYSKLNVVDEDLRNFLQALKKTYLNNTVLILMADHGPRFKALRAMVQGKFEERMPYMGIYVPPWFKTKFPGAVKNLHKNAKRLTSPFDIHETFKHILHYNGSRLGSRSQRGISLFDEIPLDRTCHDAGIENHWCACLNWNAVNLTDINVKKVASNLLAVINDLTESERALCEVLKLGEILKADMYKPKRTMLAYKQAKDADGRIPDFSGMKLSPEIFYQLTITALPGNGKFEATVQFNQITEESYIDVKDISRINQYGDQPHCVATRLPHLRKFCYCKD